MSKLRRAQDVRVRIGQRLAVSMANIIAARYEKTPAVDIAISSVVCGDEVACSLPVVAVVHDLPSGEWVDELSVREWLGVNVGQLDALKQAGVLISDDADPWLTLLRQRDNALTRSGWNTRALHNYAASRWQGVTQPVRETDDKPARSANTRAAFKRQAQAHGAAPAAFHSRDGIGSQISLAPPSPSSALTELLARRETVRLFDESTPLTQAHLSSVLRYMAGVQGEMDAGGGFTLLKKFNPSGGALHALEVYPFVLNVEALDCGFYHYRASDHSLTPLTRLDRDNAKQIAIDYLAGQTWYGSAHCLFFITARFDRSFWKYRQHDKALHSLFVDAGHYQPNTLPVKHRARTGVFRFACDER